MEEPAERPRLNLARGLALVVAIGLLPAAQCVLGTNKISEAFNEGIIDTSAGDPWRQPGDRAVDIVARRIYPELIDGYFAMGPRIGAKHDVATWLRIYADKPHRFTDLVVLAACSDGALGRQCEEARKSADAGSSSPSPSPSSLADAGDSANQQSPVQQSPVQQSPIQALPGADQEVEDVRSRVADDASEWIPAPDAPVCLARNQRDPAALTHFVDHMRFTVALERAVFASAELLVEGLATKDQLTTGAERAFSEAASYLEHRRWQRELDRRTTGMVIKGGAATGIFSAGVAWVALNMLHRYAEKTHCGSETNPTSCPRFDLVAGTSTGAFVAVAVDQFADSTDHGQRKAVIDKMAKWFTCYAINDMFCVDQRLATNLGSEAKPAKGVLEFDGLRTILNQEVTAAQQANPTESIVTTVDFRSGRLFNLSDQNRREFPTRDDVINGVIASAVLPIIATPVAALPVGPTKAVRQAFADAGVSAELDATYLDGGIRSELPVLPLARRGAERVLIASSSASVLGETGPLDNAMEIGLRYIDISTGGVTEGELAHAKRHVESVRLAESIQCRALVRADRAKARAEGRSPILCPRATCDADALCAAHFANDEVCAGEDPPASVADSSGNGDHEPDAPPPDLALDGGVPSADAELAGADGGLAPPDGGIVDGGAGRDFEDDLTLNIAPRVQLRRVWKLMGVFRDERAVGAVHGYDFNPRDQRRLFLAGADAARRRCLELARLLGIPHDGQEQRRELVRWCTPSLPRGACSCYARHRPPPPENGYRVCGDDPSPAARIIECCSTGVDRCPEAP
ncbi:MAG: patatin-like phospholipase family protein [Deltaproteobacteria bacterium]|nr:patatin-like phospholipase family protein [Deltaproteobacteria bacterium]